jgi:hypothetical protein
VAGVVAVEQLFIERDLATAGLQQLHQGHPNESIPLTTGCPVRRFCESSWTRVATFGPAPPMAWATGTVPQADGAPFELPT